MNQTNEEKKCHLCGKTLKQDDQFTTRQTEEGESVYCCQQCCPPTTESNVCEFC